MQVAQKDQRERSFSLIVTQSVVEALTNLVGRKGTVALIANFKLEDRIKDPVAFHEAMVFAFREASAQIIEKAIVKEVCFKLNRRFDQTVPFSYAAEIEKIRSIILNEEG